MGIEIVVQKKGDIFSPLPMWHSMESSPLQWVNNYFWLTSTECQASMLYLRRLEIYLQLFFFLKKCFFKNLFWVGALWFIHLYTVGVHAVRVPRMKVTFPLKGV